MFDVCHARNEWSRLVQMQLMRRSWGPLSMRVHAMPRMRKSSHCHRFVILIHETRLSDLNNNWAYSHSMNNNVWIITRPTVTIWIIRITVQNMPRSSLLAVINRSQLAETAIAYIVHCIGLHMLSFLEFLMMHCRILAYVLLNSYKHVYSNVEKELMKIPIRRSTSIASVVRNLVNNGRNFFLR